jgi:hypothetical protein
VFGEMMGTAADCKSAPRRPPLPRDRRGCRDIPALQRQSVSVCMIVKDGQGTLYRCLESVGLVADEIIVCDTGSADRSREIAREYTDRVLSIPWEDDFGAARNRSIAEAKCDWILWLDADEYLWGRSTWGSTCGTTCTTAM